MTIQKQSKTESSQKGSKNKKSKDTSEPSVQKPALELTPEVSVTFSSNFETEVGFDVIDRIDEVYVKHIQDCCAEYPKDYEEQVVTDTKLISRCALLKKLIISTPLPIQAQVQRYQDITATDLQIPPAMFTIIDTFGEASNNDLIIRLKDNVFTIHNLALDIAKIFLNHPENKYRYNSTQKNYFNAFTINGTHFGDDASTEKLRSLAEKQLDLLCPDAFELTLADGRIWNVTCSRLKVSDNFQTMIVNFLAWSNNLHPNMPRFNNLIHWGLLSFAQTDWFDGPNLNIEIRQLIPGFACFKYNITPQNLLNYINWKVMYYNDYSPDNMLISLVTAAYNHMFSASYTTLNKFFNLTEKPFNSFGIQAQLIWHNWNSFVTKRSSLQDAKNLLRSSSNGTSLIKAKNKGLIPAFYGTVKHSQTYDLCPSTGLEYLRSACEADSR